jgi:ParB-like chromosome segregation protein Spo0J
VTHVEDRTKAKKPPGEKVEAPKAVIAVFVPLDEVYADFDFNARSEANVTSEPDSAPGGGLEELATSIRTKGQDTPVILRPNVHKKGEKRRSPMGEKTCPRYEVADGFRRFVSILKLNADKALQEHSKETGLPIIPNVPNGHIAAEVRPLDDREATLLNGRMGVARNNLEPPDLMAHVVKLTRPPFSMSVGEIAEDHGLALATAHRYATVGNSLLPAILKHWRLGGEFDGVNTPKRASLEDVEEVSKHKKEDQAAAYKQALIGKVEAAKVKTWLAGAEASASRAGATLGRWEALGIVRLTGKTWDECAAALVRVPAKAKDAPGSTKLQAHLAKLLEESYEREKRRDVTKKREGLGP